MPATGAGKNDLTIYAGDVKVALFGGAGGVGASVAFNIALGGGGHEVVIVDNRPEMVTSHVMDLQQVLEQGAPGSVREGDEADLRDSDVVVLCASFAEGLVDSRLLFLERNAEIVRAAAKALGTGWGGVVLMVTNPVDPLVTLFQRVTGFDRRRVVGYTLNDSLRLRTGIALALGLEPGRVDAWVIGEHGDSSVPLFTRVSVDGEPVELSDAQRAAATGFTQGWFAKHKALDSGRSSTWTSGLGSARMVNAITGGAGERFPASIVLQGEYGIEGVSVSVPVTLGRAGVEEIHEWDISRHELAALHAAAEQVREAAARLDG
jgi:malate/lactate dehydrogenase